MKGGGLFWSVRRELWENRSVYLAPLLVAALLIGVTFIFASTHFDEILGRAASADPAHAKVAMSRMFDGIAVVLMATSGIVAWFYCLDALYGERRDRSILFWKSLPVSDATSVAAKALVPLAIVPAVTFAIILATQLVMLLVSSGVLAAKGLGGAGTLWTRVLAPGNVGVLLYALIVQALWHAPVYAYLMSVSAAVQRSPFLWAVLPFVAGGLIEKMTLGTNGVLSFVRSRVFGSFDAAFVVSNAKPVAADIKGATPWPIPSDPIPDPMQFLATPGLWAGLAVAFALLALAVWLRRRRDPI